MQAEQGGDVSLGQKLAYSCFLLNQNAHRALVSNITFSFLIVFSYELVCPTTRL
jgi:hypothetical protein